MMDRSGTDLSLKYERKSLFLGLKMATLRAMKANRGRVVFLYGNSHEMEYFCSNFNEDVLK